jgi:hypothetical protein
MTAKSQSFDRLFDAILTSSPAPEAAAQENRRRPAAAPALEIRIRRAVALFHQGEYDRCVESLCALKDEAGDDPRVDAFLAASRALALGELGAGLRACVTALRRGAHVPDVCCALGSVLLHTGDRARAHAVFRKGLSSDPVHPHLRVKLRSMGVRRPPVLRSLPRSHAVNRFLGFLRARLASA